MVFWGFKKYKNDFFVWQNVSRTIKLIKIVISNQTFNVWEQCFIAELFNELPTIIKNQKLKIL